LENGQTLGRHFTGKYISAEILAVQLICAVLTKIFVKNDEQI